MLNNFPIWKYIMIIIVVFICSFYALPNLYGENSAIQITGINRVSANE